MRHARRLASVVGAVGVGVLGLSGFTHQLIALAHHRMGAGLRHKVDPEDVVQSAYKVFSPRNGDGKLEAANWNSL